MISDAVFSRLRVIRAGVLLAVVALAVAGCATSEYKYSTKVSGGERLSFRLVQGRVLPGVEKGFETRTPVIFPNAPEKKLRVICGLQVTTTPPRAIRVEDVSDEQPILIVEDTKPEVKGTIWGGESAWFGKDDPQVKWVTYLGESFRVYRFTITTADGSTIVLHQGSVTGAFPKAMMRNVLGLDY